MKGLKTLFFVGCMLVARSPELQAYQTNSIVPEDILKMSFQEMLNVKITTAGKKEEKVADIPASVVIITRRDIEKYGYMSLEEILENVPGMYVVDDYAGYRKTFGVRGFYSGYPRNIIFLVNGVSQAETLFNYNEMSNFVIPVEAIDRIEIVRGPMSVLYGPGAFFGAINIITNSDDTSLASVSVGNGTEKAATKVAGTQGDFRYSFSAGLSTTDGPDYKLSKLVTNMTALKPWGINAANDTTGGRLGRESKNFIFSGKYKKFSADMSFNKSSDEVFIFRPSVTTGSPYDRDMAKIAIGYQDQVTDTIRLNGKISYHTFSFGLDWDIANSSFTGGNAGRTSGGSDYLEYELDAFMKVLKNLDLTTGVYFKQAQDTNFNADLPIFNLAEKSTTSGNMDLWAVFAQANFSPWEKIRFVTGLRLEQMPNYEIVYDSHAGTTALTRTKRTYDQDDIDVVPNLAAIYSFDDKNVLKLLYGKAISRPSFYQNRDQVMSGAPDLRTEEIQTFEANYISTLTPRITVNFSLFHNILDQLITRTVSTEAGKLTSNFSNGGNLVTNGAELSIQAKPCPKTLTELSLTYQKTEDQRDGFENIEVAYSPHLLGYAKIAYEITNDTTFALTGTYVDRMETEWDVRLNNFAGGRVGAPVDAYYLVGANLHVNDLFAAGWYLNIRASNLLNEEYRYPTYVNNTWADRGTLGDPLQILVTVGKKF